MSNENPPKTSAAVDTQPAAEGIKQESAPSSDAWDEALKDAPEALAGEPVERVRAVMDSKRDRIDRLKEQVKNDPNLTDAQKIAFRLASDRVGSQLSRLGKFGVDGMATREKTEPMIRDIRAREAEFEAYLKKDFPQLLDATPPQPTEDPSAIDSTPEIVFSKEDREYLKQSRGLSDAEIDAMDYDERVDFFHDRFNAVEAEQKAAVEDNQPNLGTAYQLTERGFPSDVIRGMSYDEAEEALASGAAYKAPEAQGATQPETESAFPSSKEQRLALGKLNWPPSARNQIGPELAERIIKEGLSYEQYQERLNANKSTPETAPPTTENNPILASDERVDSRAQLDKTISGLAAVAMDAKQRLNQAFSAEGATRTVEQQLFVTKMAEAAKARAVANELVRKQASKSNLLMNKLRDFEVKDLYFFSPDIKKALDAALKAEHEAYRVGVGIIPADRKHELIKKLLLEPAEAKQRAREEGLANREKGILDKVVEQYQKIPSHYRVLISGAAMAGAGAAVFGSGIGFAAVLASLGSAGVLYKASQMEAGEYKDALTSAGALLSVGGIAGAAVRYITRGLHHVTGTKKKAEKELARTTGFKDLTKFDEFLNQEQRYREALNVDKFIKRDEALFGSTASFAAGAVVGAAMRGGSAETPADTAEHTSGGEVPKPDPVDAAPGEVPPGNVPSSAELTTPVGSEVSIGATHEPIEIKIAEGDYAGKALLDLKDKLALEYKDVPTSEIPASVKHILESDNANSLSRELGFAWGDARDGSQSLTLEPGDTIAVKDGELVFTHKGEEHVMINEKGEIDALEHDGIARETEEASTSTPPETQRPASEPATQIDAAPRSATETETSAVASTSTETTTTPPAGKPVETPPAAATEAAATSSGREYYSLNEFSVDDYNSAEIHPGGLVSAPPVESFTNSFGTDVNTEQAGIYAFRPDDSGNEYPVVYGGDAESMRAAAGRFLAEHKDAKLLFETMTSNGEGGFEKQIGVLSLGDDGNVYSEPYRFEEMSPDSRIDPNQFTKPLRF